MAAIPASTTVTTAWTWCLCRFLGYGFGQNHPVQWCGHHRWRHRLFRWGSYQSKQRFSCWRGWQHGPFPAVQQTLPIPAKPGINSPAGSNISFLDSNWRPGANNQFTVSIQRELPDNMLLEVAWVGKWSKHLYQGLDLNNVPWMMTLAAELRQGLCPVEGRSSWPNHDWRAALF